MIQTPCQRKDNLVCQPLVPKEMERLADNALQYLRSPIVHRAWTRTSAHANVATLNDSLQTRSHVLAGRRNSSGWGEPKE